MKLCWPAPERNKAPILEVLARVLPAQGTLLEIAAGSGQHAAYFAAALPGVFYLPTDRDPAHIASIATYRAEAGLANLAAPRMLDVCAAVWDVPVLDAAFNANMVHIAPWEAAQGMFAGVGRALRPGGIFVVYGPYRVGGAHTAESNAGFDASLKAQDPRWGVRDLEDVVALASAHRLSLEERVAMPSNNLSLVFRRRSDV
jgi:SAM-dependent methyltransferase